MRSYASGLLSLAGILLLAVAPELAAEEVGCVTSKCHQTMGTKQFVHGPVGVGECAVCHRTVNEKDHTFQLALDGEELCFACHETSRDMMLLEHAHTPVANGRCVGCHDPHQSDFRFTLKARADDLCLTCHETAEFSRPFMHGPVEAGECNACHDPHASPHPKQLVAAPEGLCFLCHEEQAGVRDKRHVHGPVTEACTKCHDPHSNAAEFMLPEDPPGLCFSCHTSFVNPQSAVTQHPPVAEGRCNSCHDPHASDHPKLSPVPLTDMCGRCHQETDQYIAAQAFRHGPVKQGDCSACHNPHGSDHHRMLHKYFPSEFYTGYREENYALCFECHNRQIAVNKTTETLTDFRDGDRNLHYVHVNKDDKGRSCRACHQVHASSQEKHIRTSVPYGTINWELPVIFTKTEHGGSCQVGCHAPKEYSRK
jgi:predicted CXXCH cytochrome family protein